MNSNKKKENVVESAGLTKAQVNEIFMPGGEESHAYTLIRHLGRDVLKMVAGMDGAVRDVVGGRLIVCVMEMYGACSCLDCEECGEERGWEIMDEVDKMRALMAMAHDNGLVEDGLGMRIVTLIENLSNELGK